VLEASNLSGADLDAFLRREGVHEAQLAECARRPKPHWVDSRNLPRAQQVLSSGWEYSLPSAVLA
jgi:hypothetical protein